MAKILHTADLHLQQVDDERWQALLTILKTAQEQQVDAVTIAGDLFNQDVRSHQLRDKLRTVFSQQNYKIIILPGNHDARSFESGLFFGDNVTIITDQKILVKLNQTTISGLPFEPVSASKLGVKLDKLNQKLDPNQTNLVLFHGELTDLFFSSSDFGDEGQQRYMPLKLSLLTKTRIDYLLAGHFHSRSHIKRLPNQRLEQGGYFVYPGSPVAITTKETGPRSVTIIKTGQAPEPKQLETAYYQSINIQLTPDSAKQKITALENQLQQLPTQATGLITVTGFFNQNQVQTTEAELKQKLDQLAKQYHSQLTADGFQAKDITRIVNSGLYQAVMQQIAKTEFDESYQQQLSRNFIQALIQVNS